MNAYRIHGGPCTSRTRNIFADTWREALRSVAERDARRLYRSRGVLGPERVTEDGRGWVRVSVFLGRRENDHSMTGRSYVYDVIY